MVAPCRGERVVPPWCVFREGGENGGALRKKKKKKKKKKRMKISLRNAGRGSVWSIRSRSVRST